MLKRTALDDLPQAGPQEEEEKRVIKDLKAGIFRRRRIVVLIAGGGEFRANLLSRGTKQLRFELVPDLFCRLPGSLTDLAVDNSEVRSSTTPFLVETPSRASYLTVLDLVQNLPQEAEPLLFI